MAHGHSLLTAGIYDLKKNSWLIDWTGSLSEIEWLSGPVFHPDFKQLTILDAKNILHSFMHYFMLGTDATETSLKRPNGGLL